MFSVDDRERARRLLVDKAQADPRVVAAAACGSSAGEGDRWSDLDLTLGVAEAVSVQTVLSDWTKTMVNELDAAVLFDLPVGATIYRVFLLPGALQVDLSFSPAAEFGARGPRFSLLFGEAVELPFPRPPSPEHRFGMGVHHAVRARICIERGKLWQAEYWIHGVRDEAMALACSRLSLPSSQGRGFDDLPAGMRDVFAGALVADVSVSELQRALAVAIEGLMREADDLVDSKTNWLRPGLLALGSS